MINFDETASFEENLAIALSEIKDKDIAGIIGKCSNDIASLSETASSQTRMRIVHEFELLIQKHIEKAGEINADR